MAPLRLLEKGLSPLKVKALEVWLQGYLRVGYSVYFLQGFKFCSGFLIRALHFLYAKNLNSVQGMELVVHDEIANK